jgi:hypothetical protein
VANLHSAGTIPSLASAQQLGFDVRWQETYDRHRQYQVVVAASGALVGDGATDDNYLHGFQTPDAALAWLVGRTAWTTAIGAVDGLAEFPEDTGPLKDGDGNITGIPGPFSFPSESRRV